MAFCSLARSDHETAACLRFGCTPASAMAEAACLVRTKGSAHLELDRAVKLLPAVALMQENFTLQTLHMMKVAGLETLDQFPLLPYPCLHCNCLDFEVAPRSKGFCFGITLPLPLWLCWNSLQRCPSTPTLASTPDIARYLSLVKHSWNTQTERFHA